MKTAKPRSYPKSKTVGRRGAGKVAASPYLGETKFQQALRRLKDGIEPQGTVVNMIRESGEEASKFWNMWASFIEDVFGKDGELVDFSKPFMLDYETEVYYENFDDLYESEFAPWLGSYNDLLTTAERFKAGSISQADGEALVNERAAKHAKVKELHAAGGITQQQIADSVGLSQNRVSEIVSEKSSILQKTDTIDSKANEAGRHPQTQKQIEALRKTHPELAEKADKGEIKVNDALAVIGQKRITIFNNPESAARTIVKHFNDEQLADLIARLQLAQQALAS